MNIKQLYSDGKIAYLIKPILKVLQEAGGQLERSEIKARQTWMLFYFQASDKCTSVPFDVRAFCHFSETP